MPSRSSHARLQGEQAALLPSRCEHQPWTYESTNLVLCAPDGVVAGVGSTAEIGYEVIDRAVEVVMCLATLVARHCGSKRARRVGGCAGERRLAAPPLPKGCPAELLAIVSR